MKPRTLPEPQEVFRQMSCFCGVLHLAVRAASRLYNEELRKAGLEVWQFSLLRALAALGPLTQNQLGERMAAEKTTISRNVRVLQARGWLAIEQGADRRQRLVVLTARGRKRLQQARPHWERAQGRMRRALGEQRFEALRELLPRATQAALTA